MSNPIVAESNRRLQHFRRFLRLPPRRQRSFAGPFVLIVLGVVFLLGTMHVLSSADWRTCSPTTGRCC